MGMIYNLSEEAAESEEVADIPPLLHLKFTTTKPPQSLP
jgi:hypothetical protein